MRGRRRGHFRQVSASLSSIFTLKNYVVGEENEKKTLKWNCSLLKVDRYGKKRDSLGLGSLVGNRADSGSLRSPIFFALFTKEPGPRLKTR